MSDSDTNIVSFHKVEFQFSCGHTKEAHLDASYTPERIQSFIDWKKKDICPDCVSLAIKARGEKLRLEEATCKKIARKVVSILLKNGYSKDGELRIRLRAPCYVDIGSCVSIRAYPRFNGEYELLNCKIDPDNLNVNKILKSVDRYLIKLKKQEAEYIRQRTEEFTKANAQAEVLKKVLEGSKQNNPITFSSNELRTLNEYLENPPNSCCDYCGEGG